MEDYNSTISKISLFKDIKLEELSIVLNCLKAKTIKYTRDEIVLLAGDKPEFVGILLSGTARIVKDDYDGNRIIIALLKAGDFFAEALCCAEVEESPVTVVVDSHSEIMQIGFNYIMEACSKNCIFHQKVIRNMLGILAQKNLFLQNRMEIAGIKSIREKVLKYLEALGARQEESIVVPLNREGMADYLLVERSALSHELMKMKNDGLIDYKKNIFTLH